jgi:hypothetical protein
MALPEPTPRLKGKEAEEFDKKLRSFSLTDEQKRFYRKAREHFPPMKER